MWATKVSQLIKLALLGKEIDHSKSPQIYQKLLGDVSYKLLDYREKESIPHLKDLFHQHGLHGLNITSPYKSHFIGQVYIVDSSLKKLKFINCIKKGTEGFLATNTDCLAVEEILRRFIEKGYGRFILLGNGAMAQMTLILFDKLKRDFDISYLQYYRQKDGPLEELNLQGKEGSIQRTLVINSCSRNFIFRGKLPSDGRFWDYNYSHTPHQKYFHQDQYVDGYELLFLQGVHALKFLGLKALEGLQGLRI